MVAMQERNPHSPRNRSDAASFEMRLFGPFDVRVNGAPMGRLRSRKGNWLLALLALRGGGEVARSFLAGTLWPESGESQSLASLRQSLADLRSALHHEAWRLSSPTQQTLRLEIDGIDLDVARFDSQIDSDDPATLSHAIDLYRGPLLEGCTEEWAFLERERREQRYLAALEKQARHALSAGKPSSAIEPLQRAVLTDPFRESAQRSLMEALAACGDFGAAILNYRELRLRLRQELNVDPSPETVALIDRLRQDARKRMNEPAAAPNADCVHLRLSVEENTWDEALPAENARTFRYRVPRPLAPIIGRRRELDELAAAVRSSRLVTITGTGGVGKTRISIELADENQDAFPDGVYFVDLSTVMTGGVVQAIAAAMELSEEAGRTLQASLASAIGSRRMMLILDNCEHLFDESARLAQSLLAHSANLCLVATSRQPLGIVGEITRPLASLAAPESQMHIEPDEAIKFDAVRLFVDRAEASLPAFRLTAENSACVSEICRRLDGIPLALELAAARIRLLSPAQIAARLHDRFRLLTGGNRVALPRQQTLRALIDWSYDLLSEDEQKLLESLSIFVGGWNLEAAEAVCGGDEVLDALTLLVDKSLVIVEDGREERRYRLMESVREYAREKLSAQDDLPGIQARHLDHYLTLAEEADRGMRGPQQIDWLRRVDRDHDNMRSALDYCESTPSLAEPQMRIASAIWRYWMLRGHLTEAKERLGRALQRECPDCSLGLRAQVLNGAAGIEWNLGDLAGAGAMIDESLAIARQLNDDVAVSQALNNLANINYSMGEHEAARLLYEESLVLRRATGNRQLIAASINNLGIVTHALGDLDVSMDYHQQGLALCRELGDLQGMNAALIGMGNIAKDREDFETARWYMLDALARVSEIGDREGIAGCLSNLGYTALRSGDMEAARQYSRESLTLSRDIGDRRGIAEALDNFALIEAAEGRPDRAVRLIAAVDALRALIVAPRSKWDESFLNACLKTVQEQLTEAEFQALSESGSRLSAEEAAEEALNAAR